MNDDPSPLGGRARLLSGPALRLAQTDLHLLGPGASVFDAARVLAAHRLAFVVIVDEAQRPLGVVTEARLLAAINLRRGPERLVDSIWEPPLCVPADIAAAAACQLCIDEGGRPLMLVDADGRLAGAAGEGDFRAHLQLAVLAGRHRVSAVMTRVLRPLSPWHSLAQAIDQMRSVGESAVVVTEGDVAVGVLTSRDVTRLMAARSDADALTLHEVMSRPVLTLPLDASINQAAERMLGTGTRHLVVVDSDGRVAGVLDEHELTRAMAVEVLDAGIEQERQRQRALLNAIPDLVWLKDPDGVYLTCNPRFERYFGATESQIRGKTDFDFVPRELAHFFRQHDRRAIEEGGPTVNEEELTFADDGHRELVQTIKTPVHDAGGRLLGVLGIARDITALRRAEDEYRWLFARNPAPMLVFDRDTLRIVKVNEAFLQHYGWTEDEALALRVTDLSVPEDRDTARQRLPSVTGLVNVGEARHRRRDGTVMWIVAQSHDIRHEGRDARVVSLTDVTEIKRGQQRDRQRLALMERLARGDDVESLLDQLLRDHEQLFPGSRCAVMLVDESNRTLRLAAAPSLPGDYRDAVDGLEVGSQSGCCGAAAQSGQRVVADDVDTHPSWAGMRELAARAGIRSCWSEPIVGSGERVLGTFSIYRGRPGWPPPEEIDHLRFGVQLAATLIVHAGTARALRDSQRRLHDILQALPDMVWLKDVQGVYRMCNASFGRMAGRPVEQILGRRDADLTRPDAAEAYLEQDRQVLQTLQPMVLERWIDMPDGSPRVHARIVKSPLFDADGRPGGVLGVARDITRERRHEERIQRLARSYSMLSGVNEAVVRLRDRDALFAELCRIIERMGGFSMAWIGRFDPLTPSVQEQACAGRCGPDLGELVVALAARSEPAPAGAAATVVADLAADESLARWRDPLIALGHRSLALVPFGPDGGARHALLVLSESGDHFDAEQVTLLGRLAMDVAYALEFIAAEQARSDAQRFREQLIESVAGLFFACDADTRLVMWNRRLEEASGRAGDTLRHASAVELFIDDDRGAVRRRIDEAFAAGESQLEASVIGADGGATPYLLRARRLDLGHGPLVVATAIDIAERVRSEHDLAEYRGRLEELVHRRTAELEAANERLHREDRRLRAMLRLSQQASSLAEDELVQRCLQEVLDLTDSPVAWMLSAGGEGELQLEGRAGAADSPASALQAFASHVAAQGAPVAAEGDALRSLGGFGRGVERALGAASYEGSRTVFVACAAGKPTPYGEGDARELQLLSADLWRILQRRRIEIALGQAKAAADAASQAKSAFLANMSHEIRTPMNAIIGFTHLLRRHALDPRQQDLLGKITDAGQHLLQVINDVLDFSKIEAHRVTIEATDFALRDSLTRVVAMQADAARAKRLQVDLVIDPACPEALRGDRLRIEQVLLNLLSNAVKFTPAGRVELRVTLAGLDGGRAMLRFDVSDTGIGMSPVQLNGVFEAFAQADASTTRRFGGTGLGLAISKRLVQLMGGRIGVHSRPGQGSTFTVELTLAPAQSPLPPAPPEAAGPAAPAAAGSGPMAGRRLLLAEDNPINQEVAATLLTALGAAVDLARNGEEALRLFDPQRHDLVLMDVQMPGMDGLSATEAIRRLPGAARVPIIAMTANAFAEDRARCLAAGMNDYLAKPVEPQVLERCLMRWLPPLPPGPAAPGADDRPAQVQRRLRQVDGLDMSAPLARIRGQWGLYVRTLTLFIAHHAHDVERLAAAAAGADRAAMRALAHSIAGAAGTVGAIDVARLARALQQQLGTDTEPAQWNWQPLAAALQTCLRQLEAALADDTGAAPVAAAGEEERRAAAAVLADLRPLLAAHDTAALARFERERMLLESTVGDSALALGRALRSFDFAAALSALAQAESQLDPDPRG